MRCSKQGRPKVCTSAQAVQAQQEVPVAEEAPAEGVAAVLVEAAANAAEARSPAAAGPARAMAPSAGDSKGLQGCC